MIRRGGLIGIGVVAMLTMSGIAAQGASAKLYTCSPFAANLEFSNSTCTSGVGKAEYGHLAFSEHTKRKWVITRSMVIKSTHAGVKLGITATGLSGEGKIENVEGAEPYEYGEGPFVFEGVTVTEPSGKGCKVAGGAFTSKEIETTTFKQGAFTRFKPLTGTVVAEFTVEGCSVSSLNTSYKLEGSFKGIQTGSEIALVHTEVTEQGTLTLGGVAAGIEGLFDIEARKTESTEPFRKLATTPF
jgi:hypothetical protein